MRGSSVLRGVQSGWRNTVMPPEEVRFRIGDEEIEIEYRIRRDGSFWARAGGQEHNVRIRERDNDLIAVEIDGQRVAATITSAGDHHWVHAGGVELELIELPRFPVAGVEAVAGGLVAPMPAKVISTHVEAGERVEAGQLLMVLEAMKMEHRVTAPQAGVVSELRVEAGDQVANGELLVVLADVTEE